MTEIQQMVGVSGHEFEQILGDSEGQGSLACCSPWGLQRVGHNLATEQQQQSKRHMKRGSIPALPRGQMCKRLEMKYWIISFGN